MTFMTQSPLLPIPDPVWVMIWDELGPRACSTDPSTEYILR